MNLFEPELKAQRDRLLAAGWSRLQRRNFHGPDSEEWESPEKQIYSLGAAVAELDRQSKSRNPFSEKGGA